MSIFRQVSRLASFGMFRGQCFHVISWLGRKVGDITSRHHAVSHRLYNYENLAGGPCPSLFVYCHPPPLTNKQTCCPVVKHSPPCHTTIQQSTDWFIKFSINSLSRVDPERGGGMVQEGTFNVVGGSICIRTTNDVMIS